MSDTFATVWCPLCEAFTAHYALQRGYECAANVVELRRGKSVVIGTCGGYVDRGTAVTL